MNKISVFRKFSNICKAIDTSKLTVKSIEIPKIKENGDILVKVKSFGINRADIIQRQGHYPPPKGVTSILGLEFAGEIVDIKGPASKHLKNCKRIMGLLQGGGYSEYVIAKSTDCLPIPDWMDFIEAAAIPEAFIASFQFLRYFDITKTKKQNILVHAAASGIGTAAIQLIKMFDCNSIAVCSSSKKIEFCQNLGAKFGINYAEFPQFSNIVKKQVPKGMDGILDCVGRTHFDQNLESIKDEGKWVIYGFLGGSKIQNLKLAELLKKRVDLHFTSLRNRNVEYRDNLISEFNDLIMPSIINKKLKAIVDKIFTFQELKEAHNYIEQNKNIGKVVITIS